MAKNQDIKKIGLVGAIRNQAELYGKKAFKSLEDTITITLTNNGTADKTFAILNNPGVKYPEGVVTSQVVVDSAIKQDLEVDCEAGLEGFRALVRAFQPWVCGLIYDVFSDEDKDQFDKNFIFAEASFTKQIDTKLNPIIKQNKNDNNQTQFLRMIPVDFVLNPATDLIVTVKAGAKVALHLNVPRYQHLTK